MTRKKKLIIEVSPRIDDNHFHACLKDDTSIWESAQNIDETIIKLLISQATKLGLGKDDFCQPADPPKHERQNNIYLRQMVDKILTKDIKIEIHYLPLHSR